VNTNAPALGPRPWARAAVAQRRLKGTKKARQTPHACRCRRRHLLGKHPSLARWLASPAAAARCEWRVPPRLEGRGVLRGAGKLVLTYGEGGEATGHSAGVGEGGRRGFSARRKKTAARRHRSRGSRRARRCRVRLLPTGGSGLRGERRSLRQPPIPPPPTPPSPPLFPSPAAVWTGEDSPPRRLGLGEPRRLRCSYL
jgi:hypothetical protein